MRVPGTASAPRAASGNVRVTETGARRREEVLIAKAYDRNVDRALQTHRGRSRLVSAAIIAGGLLVALGIYLFADRQRERVASSVRVGDDSTSVMARMGKEPVRCPGNELQHLLQAFPAGTPRPTAEEALSVLYARTVSRWVYPDERHANACRPRRGDHEVGFDRSGRVLWVVPVHGTTPILM